MDLSLKKSNGLDLVKEINDQYPQISCLVLSMHASPLNALTDREMEIF